MKVRIVYCAVWNYEPQAVRLTEQLITEFKQALEEVTLVPAAGGRFEVYVDGEMVFSKKEAGRFPQYEEIRSVVQQRLKR